METFLYQKKGDLHSNYTLYHVPTKFSSFVRKKKFLNQNWNGVMLTMDGCNE